MNDELEKDLPFTEDADGSVLVGEHEDHSEAATTSKTEPDDKRIASSDHEGDEEATDEETEDEREERQARNRARRAQNKSNRKEYIESLKRELASRDELINDLSTRVASVEQHSVGNQAAQLDAAITEAANYYNHYKDVNRKAIEMADGSAAVDAQEKMFAAQNRHTMLQNAKKNLGNKVQQPKPLDPRMVSNAQSWMEKNSWYDPSGSDADSDIAMKIDNRLVQEGWNPNTSEYWEELDARVKKYLPHRTNSSYNKPQSVTSSKPRVPVGGSSSDAGPNSKGSYRLSAERVQALKDAGTYDDPKKLAEAIKRYQDYDRKNGSTR